METKVSRIRRKVESTRQSQQAPRRTFHYREDGEYSASGRAEEQGRLPEGMAEAYQLKLKNGGKSPSIYKPKKSVGDVDKLKRALMHLVNDISNKLSHFQENDLDSFLLPHPLLGKLTARELIFFALYHVGHHQNQSCLPVETRQSADCMSHFTHWERSGLDVRRLSDRSLED